MALTNRQQKNVEALIDQHFQGVLDDLQEKRRTTPYPKVDPTPELEQLAETHAKVLELQDRQALDALKMYNDALTSLGYEPQPIPYSLTSTPQTTQARAQGLVQRVVIDTKNRLSREEDDLYTKAWERAEAAWGKAKRDVLILSLDGSTALKLVEDLPTLESFLTDLP